MTSGRLYGETARRLAGAGIAEASLEAALLLGHVLRCTRARLFLDPEREVTPAQAAALEELLARRLRREPLAYVLGEQEFWSLPFRVCADVLIPRPESEELLERVFALIREKGLPPGPLLDLGVGSGALTTVLARELADRLVVGVDRSLAALRTAAENLERHGVRERCLLVNGDWLGGLKSGKRFALVVSNPPYVAATAMDALQAEVRDFEPRLALVAGADGLEALRILVAEVHGVLLPGGLFCMEIGWDQEEAVLALFAAARAYEEVRVHADLAGRPRVVTARCRREATG